MTTPPAPGRAEGLLACPFCGGPPVLRERVHHSKELWWRVQCNDCCAESKECRPAQYAIDCWNRRPAPAIVAEVGELIAWCVEMQRTDAGYRLNGYQRDLAAGCEAALRTLAEVREQANQMRGDIKTTEDVLQQFDGEHVWQQAQEAVKQLAEVRAAVTTALLCMDAGHFGVAANTLRSLALPAPATNATGKTLGERYPCAECGEAYCDCAGREAP